MKKLNISYIIYTYTILSSRYFNLISDEMSDLPKMPKVEAAELPVEGNQDNKDLENTEHDLQKKKKMKKEKIGFRDRKVYFVYI